MSISERIKERRKKLHYTQKLLAEKVKVSPQVISNWERGYTEPGADDIAHLSKALECSGDYLLGRTDSPETDLSNQVTDQAAFEKFMNDPNLEVFYKELPKSDEEEIEQLREFWEFIKSKKK